MNEMDTDTPTIRFSLSDWMRKAAAGLNAGPPLLEAGDYQAGR